jgi:hypothetical protein
MVYSDFLWLTQCPRKPHEALRNKYQKFGTDSETNRRQYYWNSMLTLPTYGPFCHNIGSLTQSLYPHPHPLSEPHTGYYTGERDISMYARDRRYVLITLVKHNEWKNKNILIQFFFHSKTDLFKTQGFASICEKPLHIIHLPIPKKPTTCIFVCWFSFYRLQHIIQSTNQVRHQRSHYFVEHNRTWRSRSSRLT